MSEYGLAVKMLEKEDRRHRTRRVFSYDAFVPDRRVMPDRRCRMPLHIVELEDEEIASLLEPPYEP
jgi:hypothetical protein